MPKKYEIFGFLRRFFCSESEQLRKPLPTQQAARFENQKADETSVASVPSADITDIPAAIMPELSVFPSAVAVPSIKELPLSAILPQSGAEVESVDALPALVSSRFY